MFDFLLFLLCNGVLPLLLMLYFINVVMDSPELFHVRIQRRKLLLQKKMARRAAMLEMSRKGIDKETAEAALDEVDVDYRENIRYIIEKKYRDIGDEKIKRRAVAALQRLGYGWDDIRAVLSEYEED